MTTLGSLAPWQKLLLNLTRGVAAQCVVIGHAGHYFLPDSVFPFDKLGPLGVLIFFLISGYLIAHCVLDNYNNPAYDFGRFLADRAARILTPFIPALFLVAALDSFVFMSPDYEFTRDYNVVTWVGNLLMLQDYPMFQVLRRIGTGDLPWFIGPFGSGRPFWTLNIEWALYLVFGGALFFLVRGDRPAGPGTLALIAFFAVIPIYHFAGGFGEVLIYAWLIGMGAAFLDSGQLQIKAPLLHLSSKLSAVIRPSLIVGPWFIICVRAFAQQELELLDLTFMVLLAVSLFASFWRLGAAHSQPGMLLTRAAAGLAHYSYSLYLVHNSVVVLLAIRFFPEVTGPRYLLTAFVASQLVAIMFWWLFERHYRLVRRFLNRRPRGTVELAPTTSANRD